MGPILSDISALRGLIQAKANGVDLPLGRTLRVEEAFEDNVENNLRGLSGLLAELEGWLRETLIVHDCVSLLRL